MDHQAQVEHHEQRVQDKPGQWPVVYSVCLQATSLVLPHLGITVWKSVQDILHAVHAEGNPGTTPTAEDAK